MLEGIGRVLCHMGDVLIFETTKEEHLTATLQCFETAGVTLKMSIPTRILRYQLHLVRYHYIAKHIPGKLLVIADTLSRALLKTILSHKTVYKTALPRL